MSLYKKISEIQNDPGISLPKTGEGQVGSRPYKYLDLETLHAVVLPKLQEYGLVWITMPTWINGEDGSSPALEYRLIEIQSEEEVRDTVPLCLAKNDPQGLGSAITYCRRYTLLSVLGLVGEDDDGKAGMADNKGRDAVPVIPKDRAIRILNEAQTANLANGLKLQPALLAKLTEVGVATGKIGHLNVDQADDVETFIEQESQ